MKSRWYYSHGDQTRGPFSEEEIKDHVAQRLVLEDDWVWQAGGSRESAVPAAAALNFAELPKTRPAPDWLKDVAQSQTSGPIPPLQSCPDVPKWLNDLRLWYGLEAIALSAMPPPSNPAGAGTDLPLPIRCDAIPDWLADFVPESRPVRLAAPAAVVAPSASTPRETPVSSVLPAASDLKAPLPPSAAPEKPTATPVILPGSPPAAVVPSPSVAGSPTRGAETIVKGAPLPKAVTSLAEKALQECGFDPNTGQVVDPVRFEKWKQAKPNPGASADGLSNASIMEVFRKGRIAIETWVDEESRKALVLGADMATIECDSELAAILAEFGKFGPIMLQKLRAHLAFMVENRRKYHAASDGRSP